MKYKTQQRVFLIKAYLKKRKSIKECQRKFARKYPDSPVPSKSTIRRLYKKWKSTGSVLEQKHNRRKTVLTDETLRDIGARLQLSPRKSLRRLSQEAHVSLGSAHKAAHVLNLHKIRVVHELRAGDSAPRVRFCEWLLQSVHDGLVDPELLFVTDKAYFHLSKYINSQNSRIWSDKRPNVFHEQPLHSQKVGVWCAVSARRIIGPIFFKESLNSARYVSGILEPFLQQLTEEEKEYGYFQQDNATAHTAGGSMRALQAVFGDRIISKALWPPRSPDLSLCDFYLWGLLKGKVYANNPRTLEDLQAEIMREISALTKNELQRAFGNFFRRCSECIRAEGSHFEHLL